MNRSRNSIMGPLPSDWWESYFKGEYLVSSAAQGNMEPGDHEARSS